MQAVALKEAAKTTKKISPQTLECASTKLVEVKKHVEQLSKVYYNLLPVEKPSAPEIMDKLHKLWGEEQELQYLVDLGPYYHRLSLELLKWRDKNGFPRLMVFDLDWPEFQIVPKLIGEVRPESLPKEIKSCYQDVIKRLERSYLNYYDPELSCKFTGILPFEIREQIQELRKYFPKKWPHRNSFDPGLFLIAEPKNWEIKHGGLKPDPLLVGWDGKHLWLFADFDTTSVEEAMIFELPRN